MCLTINDKTLNQQCRLEGMANGALALGLEICANSEKKKLPELPSHVLNGRFVGIA